MTVFDRIKFLAKKHSKTMKQVTLDLNYSENYFYSLKKGKQPSAEKLNEIADYFGVSVDYLLGRTENEDRKLGARGELLAAHIDDDVSEKDMQDILNYIEFRKNNPL
ncbi:helix-turn-helix domain-containing protein [Enterococcus sp.]|uniref:helix-turn-helix domain-containing protein n=1 Tax=Enterococcus sp. TaxID=35783 RepID=UPI0018848619|nr:helix-turn-helix transcriptional regulator [Enterococcus sp.]MBE9895304.1 helix-turn-helix transcriptional regulator [Enterococcus casseliflavus]